MSGCDFLQNGRYDLLNARDTYRHSCGPEGLNRHLIIRFIEANIFTLSPILSPIVNGSNIL